LFFFFSIFVVCWSLVNSVTWGLLYSVSLDAGSLVFRTWTDPPGAVGASQFVYSVGNPWRWAGLQQMSHVWCQLYSSNSLTFFRILFTHPQSFLPGSIKYWHFQPLFPLLFELFIIVLKPYLSSRKRWGTWHEGAISPGQPSRARPSTDGITTWVVECTTPSSPRWTCRFHFFLKKNSLEPPANILNKFVITENFRRPLCL
jgi:hypothetical protein